MIKQKILKDTSDWLSGYGICSVLTNLFEVPWKESVSGVDLDLDYYANRSMDKLVSDLVDLLSDDEGKLSNDNLVKLATIIYSKYGKNWDRAFYAFEQEYNPVYNYLGDEEGKDTKTITYEGKEITDENIEDKNKDNLNHGIVSINDKTFPTERKTTVTESGQKEDKLEFSNDREDKIEESGQKEDKLEYSNDRKNSTKEQGRTKDTLSFTNRNHTSTYNGDKVREHNAQGNDNYSTTTKTYGKNYNQHRVKSLDSGFVSVSEDGAYTGSGLAGGSSGGPDHEPDSSHNHTTQTIETGKYTDKDSFNNYTETVGETGTEEHTIDKTGINGSGDYKVETDFEGSETHTIKTTGAGGSGKYTTDKKYIGDETHTIKTTGIDGEGKYTTESVESGSERDQNVTTNYQKLNTNTEKSFEDRTDTETLEHKFHREGNYGMLTSQQMLEQEVELRQKYSSLFDCIVFPDIDKVMTTGVFKKTRNF